MALSTAYWGAIDTSTRTFFESHPTIVGLADFLTEYGVFADYSKPKQQTNPGNITEVLTLNLVRART